MRRVQTLLLAAAILSGCATVDPSASYPAVVAEVQQRLDKQVYWEVGSAQDAQVQEEIDRLLTGPLLLQEAVQIALLNNPALHAVYEDLAVAQAEVVDAGLLQNPIFNGEFRFAEGGGRVGLELAVVQDFLRLLFLPMRTKIAESHLAAAQKRVTEAVMDVAARTRRAYLTLHAAEQMAEMQRTALATAEASLALSEQLVRAGNVSQLEALTARAAYGEAKVELAERVAEVALLRERLNVLLGVWGTRTHWVLPRSFPAVFSVKYASEEVERTAIDRNLQLSAMRDEIHASSLTAGVAVPMQLFEGLELGVITERESDGAGATGPILSIPLPLVQQGQPAAARAQAELRRAVKRYEARAVQVRSRARWLHAAVVAAHDRAHYLQHTLLPLYDERLAQGQRQYNAMQISAFELLRIRHDQIAVQVRAIEAQRDFWIAHSDLELLLAGYLSNDEAVRFSAIAAEG